MSANLNKHLKTLSKRGPHRVMVGDLGYTGITGKIYTPAEGDGVPGIAFGHDWTKPVDKYHATLRHFASWGIAVAAPDTETGIAPDHRGFAADLETAMQILGGVKLGHGNVTVNPSRLGVVGHGMGAGAAILASINNPKVHAVGAIYPAETAPSSEEAAKQVSAPGLVIGSQKQDIFGAGNPPKVAYNWRGEVVYREIQGGNQQGFSEDTLFKFFVGIGLPQFAAQETVRGLVTGFLLHQLGGENKYSDFSEADATGNRVTSAFGMELAEKAGLDTSVTISGGSTAHDAT